MPDPIVYVDDTDASWTFTVTSTDGTTIDWATPVIAINNGTYTVAGTWLGSPATSRQIRVPLVGLTGGTKTFYLRVPGGTDILLGKVTMRGRT